MMKKERNEELHIIYIVTKLELGGAQKVCLSLFKNIQKKQSASIISGNQGVLVEQTKKFDHVFLLNSLKREVSIKNIWLEVKNFFTIIKIIRSIKRKYSNIVVHTHSTKAGLLGRWAAFFAGIKKRIHTVHGYGFNKYQPKFKQAVIYLLELVTSFITTTYVCVSQEDQQTGSSLFPRFKKKSVVIRAAVEWETFYIPSKRIAYNPQESFAIGTISCFKPQKNLIDLLKAFALARSLAPGKNITLEMIGDGAQRQELISWINKNNLTNYVTMHGWQHNVSPFLKRWDIFALSSLWEGLPCAVIEARLQKLPIIAYDVGGIKEVVFNLKNGFLVPPGNWQQLGEELASLCLNKDRFEQYCQYKDNLSDFKNETMVQKHLDLYHNLVQSQQCYK